jgi:hypothetical protein
MRVSKDHFAFGRWIAVCSLICFNQLASAHVSGPSTLQNLSPSIGTLFGGEKVTITGKQLYHPQQVTFGGVSATILSSGVTFINVITPPHAVGAVDVAVVNSAGIQTSLTNGYTYTIAITTSGLPDGIAGISYSQTLAVTGGIEPYQWSVAAGSLPSGLALDSATGIIAGSPAADYGTVAFTVQVTDSSSPSLSATANLSITIDIGLKPGPIPASFFGLSTINPENWPSISFGAYGKGGETTWPYLEPAKGQFNWARLDAFVANAQANGMIPFWTNLDVPQWAAADPSTCSVPQKTEVCTSTVANIADWDDFCTALVQRYKGQILMYELWNQPDTNDFTGTLADMVELTQHLYNAIRANDPSALIATPSIVNASWLASYFAAGGPTGIDVIAIHGYMESAVNEPEDFDTYRVIPWHAVMLQYGLGNKPIWDTEASWGQDANSDLDADAEAAFLARFYILHWSAGVTSFYWYAWDSSLWGTLWNSGVVIEPGVAYNQVYQWLSGATMPQPCANQGTVYTCSLSLANGYSALAVWDSSQTCTTGGGCTTSNYTAPAPFVQYQNLAGVVTSIQPGQVILIGAKPILLENPGSVAVSTTTTVSANPTSIASSGSTVLTATVSAGSGTTSPTGSVSFAVGQTALGAGVLSGSGGSATASLTVQGSQLASGSNLIVASYGGSATFQGSSASVTVNVTTVCNYSLSPNSVSLGAGETNGTVGVTAGSGCAWTASSNAFWLMISSGTPGSGDGTVGYSVAANLGTTVRSGTLTIAGQTFTVTQAPAPTALGFFTLTPCRVADTRAGSGFSGAFGAPSLAAQVARSFAIPTSACDVPATAQAYSLNITVVPPGPLDYLTVWPTGQSMPVVSTLNDRGCGNRRRNQFVGRQRHRCDHRHQRIFRAAHRAGSGVLSSNAVPRGRYAVGRREWADRRLRSAANGRAFHAQLPHTFQSLRDSVVGSGLFFQYDRGAARPVRVPEHLAGRTIHAVGIDVGRHEWRRPGQCRYRAGGNQRRGGRLRLQRHGFDHRQQWLLRSAGEFRRAEFLSFTAVPGGRHPCDGRQRFDGGLWSAATDGRFDPQLSDPHQPVRRSRDSASLFVEHHCCAARPIGLLDDVADGKSDTWGVDTKRHKRLSSGQRCDCAGRQQWSDRPFRQ